MAHLSKAVTVVTYPFLSAITSLLLAAFVMPLKASWSDEADDFDASLVEISVTLSIRGWIQPPVPPLSGERDVETSIKFFSEMAFPKSARRATARVTGTSSTLAFLFVIPSARRKSDSNFFSSFILSDLLALAFSKSSASSSSGRIAIAFRAAKMGAAMPKLPATARRPTDPSARAHAATRPRGRTAGDVTPLASGVEDRCPFHKVMRSTAFSATLATTANDRIFLKLIPFR
mmetsp:Transcript_37811/g.60707  ORF Transcript_37811/g.60707 Transcript_37811/m.60707 type:complete len:232 (+) Transcript_37811:154-849(+)